MPQESLVTVPAVGRSLQDILPPGSSRLLNHSCSPLQPPGSSLGHGGRTLPPIAVGPCEPGQVLTEAALSIGSQVHAGVAFWLSASSGSTAASAHGLCGRKLELPGLQPRRCTSGSAVFRRGAGPSGYGLQSNCTVRPHARQLSSHRESQLSCRQFPREFLRRLFSQWLQFLPGHRPDGPPGRTATGLPA